MHVRDESKPDEVTKLFAGDVIHVDHDSRNTFLSPTKAKCKNETYFKLPILWILMIRYFVIVFAASYAPSHLHPEDYILSKK